MANYLDPRDIFHRVTGQQKRCLPLTYSCISLVRQQCGQHVLQKHRIDQIGRSLQRGANRRMEVTREFVWSVLYQMNHEAMLNDVRTFHPTINGYSLKLLSHGIYHTEGLVIWLSGQDYPNNQRVRLVGNFGYRRI